MRIFSFRVQFRLLVFFLLFVSKQPYAQYAHLKHEPHATFANLVIDRLEFQSILQNFVTSGYQKAFRELGVKEDFFHGHLLYTEDALLKDSQLMHPSAILYHTQEEASHYSKSDPGGQWDYLDKYSRNWIQFLVAQETNNVSRSIFNAYGFMYDYFSKTEQNKRSLYATDTHFTVFEDQLDSRKFPNARNSKLVGSRQVNFYKIPCSSFSELNSNELLSIGDIKISLPGEEIVCLKTDINMLYTAIPTYEDLSNSSEKIVNSVVPEEIPELY